MNKFLIGAAIGAAIAYFGHRSIMNHADGSLAFHKPKKEDA